MMEDLHWFGLEWQEGPDCRGPYAPYSQSARLLRYRLALEKLRAVGVVYPCTCSRQDVARAATAPHAGEDEPIYPGTCRSKEPAEQLKSPRVNWRFRVPDGEAISFVDGRSGKHSYTAGQDFGDFILWRHDDVPAYQLAVVVDDAGMEITEVVRGEDLLKSTARQILLYRAFGLGAPAFYHCPLVTDTAGVRLAKRDDALSLRTLRASGSSPAVLRSTW
jgi:glutamyl/glutaminyl-tRNA synthetase